MNTEYHQEVDTEFFQEGQAVLLGTPVVDSYASKQIYKFFICKKDFDLRSKNM